jgi:hypothetical protein
LTDDDSLVVRIEPELSEEPVDLAEMTGRLRAELLELDVAEVNLVGEEVGPDRAKGLATLVGWLVVHFGAAGLRAVIQAVRSWSQRNDRVVEVTYGGDTLKVTGATSEQQERIIDAWLARHAPGGQPAT